jgi:hypothetical protein
LSMKKKGVYAGKIKKATQMLFYKRHQKPGVKGWELHKALGAEYPRVLEVLDDYLKPMDLQIKSVFEEDKKPEKPTIEELDKARFFVVLRGGSVTKDKLMGWRIDDLAGLAITISFIISKKGQAPRKEIEKLLGEKMPGWKIGLNIDRYIRSGYLMQDDKDLMYLDWRTRVEVDEKALIEFLLAAEKDKEEAVYLEPKTSDSEETEGQDE